MAKIMINIIASFIMWLISLTIAFVCIRQPKGIDWYAPISKKQKMIMSLINLSILIFIIIIALASVNDSTVNVVVISICCVATIVYLSIDSLVSKIKTAIIKPAPATSVQQNTQIDIDDGQNTLKDIFSKVLTVFNSVFVTLNITYCVIIMYCKYESWDVLLSMSISELDSIETVLSNNVLPVHITFLFWSTLAAIIMTSRGWKFSETINNLKKNKKVTVHTAKYYADRITNRNRKRSP